MKEEAKERLTNDLIGVAGVHFVAYRLSLRGLIALPTIRNTAGIDLLVTDPTTGGQASLQVKTSMKKVKFWPTSKPGKCLRGAGCYYVFLRWVPGEKTFEAFLETADAVADQVAANAEDYRKKRLKEWSFWSLVPAKVQELADEWESWSPPRPPR